MPTAADRRFSDPHRRGLVASGGGLLVAFNRAEVLDAADVHVARRLAANGGERDERVLLALALTVRAVRAGSVCLDLAQVRAAVTGVQDGDPLDPAAAEALDPDLVHRLTAIRSLDWPDPQQWQSAVLASPLVAAHPAPDAGHGGPARPLRWADGLLYLDRYWRQERLVAGELDLRGSGDPRAQAVPVADEPALVAAIGRLFPAPSEARQRIAAAVCATRRLTVVAGGPGTGKTTAVARMLAVLVDQPGPRPRIALAAPTGKAAARLAQAVREEIATFAPADRDRLGQVTASTLHRLLGWRPGSSSRFVHDKDNRLPWDIVVVDETSMVSLTMMARLLEALRTSARLVLVGDPDQLASVEAGAVLGDVVARATGGSQAPGGRGRTEPTGSKVQDVQRGHGLTEATGSKVQGEQGGHAAVESPAPGIAGHGAVSGSVTLALQRICPADFAGLDPTAAAEATAGVARLTHRFRFGGAIAQLADAVRSGDPDAVLQALRADPEHITFLATPADPTAGVLGPFIDDVVSGGRRLAAAACAGDVSTALQVMDEHRVLCAHRNGPFGAARWAAIAYQWISESLAADPLAGTDPLADHNVGVWRAGRPLLITENDYELGLFNGDTGVIVLDPKRGPVAAFGNPADPIVVRPGRLAGVQSVYAMTVHKSQGSQFRSVTAILPPAESPLLTRELLYTAVTRASGHVRVIGTPAAVTAAVLRPVTRASGLRSRGTSIR